MNFCEKLLSGQFTVIAEMNTPKGVNISAFMENSKKIKGKVDAVIIPDSNNGSMRMSSIAGASLLERQGIDTIIYVYARDKNRISLQSDFLGAHVLGINNFVITKGEEVFNCDNKDAFPVNDLDELGIASSINSLNAGKDIAGLELDGVPELNFGIQLPFFKNYDIENIFFDSLSKQIKLGASFILIPPFFNIDKFKTVLYQIKEFKIPVISSVYLLKSPGVARYISINEPDAGMSEDIIKRIRLASNRELECIAIASETVNELSNITDGVVIKTLGWENRILDIIDMAGL